MNEILFLCPHGGAKSVIAATYFNSAGLPVTAVAAAADEPYDEVPAPVTGLLQREGFDVGSFHPRRVDERDLERALRIIAIGCEVEGAERWDDVPQVSEDPEGSAAAIRRHVDALVEELRG